MITCYLKYTIDPYKVEEFTKYGKMWIPLVNEMGGNHHGYFVPYEGANNIGYALFSFPSLSEYETYRNKIHHDDRCINALKYAKETGCIFSFERSFVKPILE